MYLVEDDLAVVLKAFAEKNSLAADQLNSYNSFISDLLPRIVSGTVIRVPVDRGTNIEGTSVEIRFEDPTITKPMTSTDSGARVILCPNEARIRNLTYQGKLHADVITTVTRPEGEETIRHPRLFLANIPVMVRSSMCSLEGMGKGDRITNGECGDDVGGYFIVNGNERVLVGQERVAYDRMLVFKGKADGKYVCSSEVRSLRSDGVGSTVTRVMLTAPTKVAPSAVMVQVPRLHKEVPLRLLMRAFGCQTDAEILDAIIYDTHEESGMAEVLRASLATSQEVASREDALAWIGSQIEGSQTAERLQQVGLTVLGEMMPCMGDSLAAKARFVGYMVRRMLRVHVGECPEDDRDHMANKRVDMAGELMAQLFRSLFHKMCVDARLKLDKLLTAGKSFDTPFLIKSLHLSDGLMRGLSTGNWSSGVSGVSQVRTGLHPFRLS